MKISVHLLRSPWVIQLYHSFPQKGQNLVYKIDEVLFFSNLAIFQQERCCLDNISAQKWWNVIFQFSAEKKCPSWYKRSCTTLVVEVAKIIWSAFYETCLNFDKKIWPAGLWFWLQILNIPPEHVVGHIFWSIIGSTETKN